MAQAIHYESARAAGPFVAVDCSATPEALVESAFYGHVKGAFTDAREDRKGYFEQADGGTLFLDEVGDMAPPVQAKLLRALEERRVRPVGGATEIPVDVRVISATNRDLPGAVAAGRFREDLYYRLNVFAVRVPPLRERREDVLVLANHFLNGYARELHKPLRGFSPEAAVLLAAHPFPGNVRELRNLVERAAILCEEGEVGVGDLRFDPVPHSEPSFGPPLEHVGALGKFLRSAENLDLAEAEAEMVREALRRCGGNQVLSAGMLGISRNALRRRMERYRIGNVEYRMGG